MIEIIEKFDLINWREKKKTVGVHELYDSYLSNLKDSEFIKLELSEDKCVEMYPVKFICTPTDPFTGKQTSKSFICFNNDYNYITGLINSRFKRKNMPFKAITRNKLIYIMKQVKK